MNLYFELMQKPVFCMNDVNEYYENNEGARSAVKRLLKRGLILRIRKDLYTCISGETGAPIANRFQIASAITESSYVSHHTAMEYHGITDQVFYDVYVSSETRFSSFSFDGYGYIYVCAKSDIGVEHPAFSGGIAVTDIERSLVDCIRDMDKISGPEEVLNMVKSIKRLNEEKLLLYLATFQNQFLYQKTGYLLQRMNNRFELPEHFFEECLAHIGKSKRYFTKEQKTGKFDSTWNLIIPDELLNIENGVILNAKL